jgi:hypothetical protein
MLTPEPEAAQTSISQFAPQTKFGIGHILPHRFGEAPVRRRDDLMMMRQ